MLNTGDVWCGVVTVAAATSEYGFDSVADYGSLTDNSGDQMFTYGTDPTITYEVRRVAVGVGTLAGALEFGLQGQDPNGVVVQALTDDHRAKLVLFVGSSSTPLAFSSASHNARTGYNWRNTGLDWSSSTTVTVRLRELPDAPTGFEAGVGNAQVALTWDTPASGANITRHEYRFKTGGGSYPTTWTPIATSAPGGTNQASYTVTGLTNEIAHTFELRAANDSGGSAAVEDGPVTPTPGICDRTEKIQEVILAELSAVTDCKAVTVANLASITKFGRSGLALFQQGITSLKAGDFAGLTALQGLNLNNNQLTVLPDGIFSDLTAITEISVAANQLTALPEDIFAGLAANLGAVFLNHNSLTDIPAGVFAELSLSDLTLVSNALTGLPDGTLSGQTGLTLLTLGNNPDDDDVMPLTVTVEKVGTDQVRVEVPVGAPFAVEFTAVVANGALAGGATTLAVPAGSVAGTAVTVTRTSGTTEPVTVDIDLTTQPSLPTNHVGYEFAKVAGSEPKEILSDVPNEAPVFDPAEAEREVAENSAAGTNVGAVIPVATDADNDTLEYSLEGTDARFFDFNPSTRQITTKANVTYNYEAEKNSYEVKVKADDGNDGTDTIDVNITLLNADEKSAKPDKPVLAAVSGSTSLTATWEKPGLNGGPDIIGYEVEYRQGSGNWQNFPHGDTALTTTITGLMAETEYQVRVRAENGETDSDWSDPSDLVRTGDPGPTGPPRVTSVVVASAPQSGDTYGLYETILFTVTFSEPVEFKPQGRLRLKVGLDNPGGASGSTVEAVFWGLSQSQYPTADTPQVSVSRHMHFEYKVQLFDRDANGVSIRANALRLAPGARIRTEDGVDAMLDHAAVGPLSDHKVDGSADVPVIERIEVVSTPRLVSRGGREPDTYGEGETIRIEVRFNQPVHVEGEPTFALVVGDPCGSVCEARYESGGGTDTLVFAYLVLDGDIDRNGIAIPANPIKVVYGDSIRNAADQEAHLSYRREGTQSGHKTDGSRAAAPHLSVEDAEAHEADGKMAFTVRLEPHGLGIVTVDYATRDGSAQAGEDYTETSGTLRFNPLETERTVTVPIIDDAHEDDGETFTLRLSNPDDARLLRTDREATGRIRNSDPEAAAIPGPGGPEAAPLTASFEAMPGEHDGARAFTFRIAFTEPLSWMNGRRLREDVVAVAGGRATSASRVNRRRDLWQVTVEPDSPADVTVTLAAGAACDTPAAVCTKDGRALSTTIATTVAGPPAAPLTASFEGVPSEHDGQTVFTLRMAFTEPLSWMNGRRLREHVVTVAGGRATKASRVNRRRDLWQLTVEPDSPADATVTVAAGAACGTPAAVCTKDGRALSTTIATTVRGPVAVSVADARAEEGTDETLDFAVTLSRAASATVAVAYATADGTATAGADYTRTSGTLTFAPGETATTVRVPVLDDAHDEGEETLTLRLSAASGAVLADGTATGTIENSDHMQRAWLARFGRTAATHVTDAVGDRLRGTPGQGSHLTVGGYRLPLGQRGATDGADDGVSGVERLVLALGQRLGLGTGPAPAGAGGVAGAGGWPDAPVATDPRLGQSRTLDVGNALNLRQVLLGSSFRLALSGDAVGARNLRLTAWGRVAGTTFDGQDGALSLNGDVLTGTVGVDGEWDRLLAGLAVAHSRGDGSYTNTMPDMDARGRGDLEQTLTSVHPYLRYAVNDRLAVWGLLGFGTGQMEMEVDTGEIREADTDLLMGAFGGRGILLAAPESGGFQLATRTDAMLTRTTSDAVAGMESAEADAHRLRLVLEGSRGFTWAEGRRLTPTMEVGLRHDWGDAETGFGLELGGRVQYADPALGLTIDATVRGLLAHEDDAYQEWGASGTVRLNPGATGQGLSLTLAPAWGATASGVDGLWSRQTTAGLAPQGTRQTPAGRLNAEVGYGFAPFGTGLLTPYAGTVLSEGAARTYRVGGRLQMPGRGTTGLQVSLEGTAPGTGRPTAGQSGPPPPSHLGLLESSPPVSCSGRISCGLERPPRKRSAMRWRHVLAPAGVAAPQSRF